MTSQWLKGKPDRNRPHAPLPVAFRAWKGFGEPWDQEHKVIWILEATQDDGTYQQLYITSEDIAAVLPKLTGGASPQTLEDIACVALSHLNDAQFWNVLRHVLARRAQGDDGG